MIRRTIALSAALFLAACAQTASGPAGERGLLPGNHRPAPAAHDAFFAHLAGLCGQRFAGTVVSEDPADAAFAGKPLVIEVRDCASDALRIGFTVGDDRSRTWVVTRNSEGLILKHDHRHADGTEDALSQYGGASILPGTAVRQEFPADAFSRTLFLGKGNPASVDNVWAVEVYPGRTFAYELRRPNRFFRVEFDLSKPL